MKTKETAYTRIRRAMRKAEVEVLQFIRESGKDGIFPLLPGGTWRAALDRLHEGKQVYYKRGRYFAHRGARPVTFVRGR